MNTIGVALVRRGGNYYAVVDFADGVAQLGPEQIEQKIGALLQQRGLSLRAWRRIAPDLRNGARLGRWFGAQVRHALGGNGFEPSAGRAGAEIATHQYHKAAVGACGNPTQGFTTYKLAVMLY